MSYIKKEKGFFSTRCDIVKKAIRQGFLACHEAMHRKLRKCWWIYVKEKLTKKSNSRMAKNAHGASVYGGDHSGSSHNPWE